ncbi:hypothetical protein HSBAA_32420 [Vreelandella sulfidaeris]|uniref:carbonic anhydrase n=1 Tax=Vreelandella sulfidaeris TaxID=115553 RepID=A0A455U749_9GAMM|nr:hypothetical protein HSBAA_32420 [Halomonas sulfidaeris]
MSDAIATLLDNNRAWAERMCEEDPDYFKRLSNQQNPDYLWIGCSDSRVPANQIIALLPERCSYIATSLTYSTIRI